MSNRSYPPLSVLDLAFVREGETPREALLDSRELARQVERFGFRRFWMAEHHNMEGVASAATAVALGFVAEGTSTIRIGSGGIMLPNHSPLVVAEQFGTLASLYPGRVDLGLGRAPGTDPVTSRALRRHLGHDSADTFPQDVLEIQALFGPPAPGRLVHAVPGEGLEVPIWILGSSLFGAQLAALLGLPFAFASHFAPEHLFAAIELYREQFQPSEHLERPHVMVAANVVVADTDEEAEFIFSSAKVGVWNLVKGRRGKMQPPVADVDRGWAPEDHAAIERFLRYSFVGDPSRVSDRLSAFAGQTGADELIVTARIYSLEDRIRSFERLANVWAPSLSTRGEACAL